MKRFSDKLRSPGVVRFIPATIGETPAGGTTQTYPTPYSTAGVAVIATVQFKQIADTSAMGVSEGVVRFTEYAIVAFLDDPTPLNGGLGVRRLDALWWDQDGRLLIVQGDPVPVGTVWRVTCLVTQ